MSTGLPTGPGAREPGLDHLIRALAADGHPHELAGRDAALAAFRAARDEERRRTRFALPLSRPGRLGMRTRLATAAAAFAAGLAGVTAAAYAQALPAPVQQIAHSVLAPFGVPDSHHPASPARPGRRPGSTPPGPAPGSAASGGHGKASPAASCPCRTGAAAPAIAGSALVLTVGRGQLPAGGGDAFAGKLTHRGRPEAGVRVQLLEQAAAARGWQVAGTGVTGKRGRVRFRVWQLARNAVFRLAVPGGADSAEVSVTVLPRVVLRLVPGVTTDRLVATAPFGDPGDAVVLEELSGGTWRAVATQPLGAAHRAVFGVPASAAADYRAVLQATGVHGRGVSGPVRQGRGRSRTGAQAITPTSAPRPAPTDPPAPVA